MLVDVITVLSVPYIAFNTLIYFVLYLTYCVATVATRHLFQKQKRGFVNYFKIIVKDASTVRMYHMHRIATKGGQF